MGGAEAALTVDGPALAGQLAVQLAQQHERDPLPAALAHLVAAFGLRDARLQESAERGGALWTATGAGQRASAGIRLVGARAPASVQLPLRLGDRDLATLTVTGCRPGQLPALRACAAVLTLALAAHSLPSVEAAALLLAAESDRAAFADTLHDGPLQALVVARYAADAVVRGADPALAREAVQAALVMLRRALWHLRPRAGLDLPTAVNQLGAHLREAGLRAPRMQVGAGDAGPLPAAAAGVAYRLIQATALAQPGDAIEVVLTAGAGGPELTVHGDVPEPARWQWRLGLLGATSTAGPDGMQICFPPAPAVGRPTLDARATP